MANNDYHFITHWRVRATAEEVSQILSDTDGLVRWWPSVYLKVTELEPGDAQNHSIGRLVDLHTKGWLPYTLKWQFRLIKADPPHGFTIEALGDFVGRGIWTLAQDGEWLNVTYDWKIQATKPILRRLSFLLKPVFEANHVWAMRKGEESLKLELERHHARTSEEKARIPAPPRPTFVQLT